MRVIISYNPILVQSSICLCVICLYSLLDRIVGWLAGGGVIIVGSCLATLGTVVVLLSVALLVVRAKRRRRSSSGTGRLPMTKVELQQPMSSSASGDLAVCHPLLESDKLCDEVTIRQFDNEPVRYVVSRRFDL